MTVMSACRVRHANRLSWFARRTLQMLLLSMLAVAGCQPSTPKTSVASGVVIPLNNSDPCAMRLHDISGAFLLYMQKHNDLPLSLDEIAPYARILGVKSMNCPDTGVPYIYTRDGILLPEQNARIILYDPQPSPAGYRWAISLGAKTPDSPPQTKVVAFPESFFQWR